MSQRKSEVIVKSSNRSSVKPAQRKQRNTHMNQNQPGKVTRTFPPRANDTEKKAEIPKTWKTAVDKRRKKHFCICEV